MLCTDLTLVKDDPRGLYVKPLPCNCWHCPLCAPKRRRKLKRLAMSGHPDVFLTLTVKPTPDSTPDERAQQLVAAWRTVMSRAKAENMRDPETRPHPYGVTLDPERSGQRDGITPRQVRLYHGKLPFIAVFEQTKAGEPHLHIVARAAWINQEWLSKTMASLIGAPIVDVRRVKSREQAAAYVTKYMSKNPHVFDGCKRYWRSQDYDQTTAEEKEAQEEERKTWHVHDQSLGHYLRVMLARGYTAKPEGDGYWLVKERSRAPP